MKCRESETKETQSLQSFEFQQLSILGQAVIRSFDRSTYPRI